jgi:phage shock protein A
MGIFKRLSDIITANVNDLLDRAEDPEKMIKQVVREMEEAVEAARRNAAQAMASQKKLARELETDRRLRDEWEKKAVQALEGGREDLAREALGRKKEYEALIETLQAQFDKGEGTCHNLRQTLRALQAKLAEAKRKQLILSARRKAAEAELAAQSKLGGARDKAAAFAKFDAMEEKVEDLEAQAEALKELNEAEGGLEAELEDLSQEKADIEKELAALKSKLKRGKKS